MVRGLYTAASAMLVYAMRQDMLSEDLANVNTPAYRPQDLPIEAFPTWLIYRENDGRRDGPLGWAGTGTFVGESFTRWSPAPIQYTGRTLDLALEGDGFFVVSTPAGTRLVRSGRLTVDASGRLTTPEGWTVLATNGGPLQVGDAGDANGGQLVVGEDGTVRVADGTPLGQLMVVDVADPRRLAREGGGLYRPTQASGGPVRVNTPVRQGYLEGSASSVVATMARMVEGVRAYEAAQRAVRVQDELTGQLIAQVARVS